MKVFKSILRTVKISNIIRANMNIVFTIWLNETDINLIIIIIILNECFFQNESILIDLEFFSEFFFWNFLHHFFFLWFPLKSFVFLKKLNKKHILFFYYNHQRHMLRHNQRHNRSTFVVHARPEISWQQQYDVDACATRRCC